MDGIARRRSVVVSVRVVSWPRSVLEPVCLGNPFLPSSQSPAIPAAPRESPVPTEFRPPKGCGERRRGAVARPGQTVPTKTAARPLTPMKTHPHPPPTKVPRVSHSPPMCLMLTSEAWLQAKLTDLLCSACFTS